MTLFLLLPILLIVYSSLYVPLTSPLASLPGPFYTKFTSLFLKYHELRATRTRYIHTLHLRYGPVVRIAPNEASFASKEGVKEIYCSGGSGYDKSAWYDLFRVYGRRWVLCSFFLLVISAVQNGGWGNGGCLELRRNGAGDGWRVQRKRRDETEAERVCMARRYPVGLVHMVSWSSVLIYVCLLGRCSLR